MTVGVKSQGPDWYFILFFLTSAQFFPGKTGHEARLLTGGIHRAGILFVTLKNTIKKTSLSIIAYLMKAC